MSTTTICQIALKEWAVTVKALDRGEQIILLRKGGIREEGKDFRVLYPEFLLYPTFEHQKEELLQEKYHWDLRQVLSEAQGGDAITFSHWAEVDEVIELTEQNKLDTLSHYHIWSDDYAQKRLHWKPRSPLSVMLLRLYRLDEPRTVTYLPSYSGCKSWVELSEGVALGHLTPVLTEDDFRSKIGEVKTALGL